jgi:hypothetical protein
MKTRFIYVNIVSRNIFILLTSPDGQILLSKSICSFPFYKNNKKFWILSRTKKKRFPFQVLSNFFFDFFKEVKNLDKNKFGGKTNKKKKKK